MAMTKARKATVKADIAGRLKKANAAMTAEYRGLTVQELTELRVKLREAKAEFKIVKNRVAKVAITEGIENIEALKPHLKGPVGIVIAYGDPAAAAKSLIEFGKDRENFKVTGGVMEGKGVTAAQLKAISELPSKEVLLSRLVGSLISPHRGILGVLQGVQRNLVQVVNAIKDTKQ